MRKKNFTLSFVVPVLLAILLPGCAARQSGETGWSEVGRPVSDLVADAPIDSEKAPSDISYGDPSGLLTLREALALALLKNPELAAFSWEVRAAEARTLQAGVLPNPSVGVEVENFAGSGERQSFDTAETTVALSQLIELGGKRGKRERVATLQKDLAGWDYEAKRLDVLTETAKIFVDLLGAQQQFAYAAELVRLAEMTHRTVSERVEAGKVSPLEAAKAGVTLANTRLQHAQAQSNLAAARKKLSLMWGESAPSFERAEGDLEIITPAPSAEELSRRLAKNPDIARWVKESEQRAAALELEKAKSIPDLTVSGGVRSFNDENDSAFVVGVSIPIPLFDRNQGGALEAGYNLAKAKEERRAAEARAGASLAESHELLAFSYDQATVLRSQVLPAAEHAFAAAGEGYREGKFDFLELLDAQRTLFEARGRYIEALIVYHKTKADVERLIGESMESADNEDNK